MRSVRVFKNTWFQRFARKERIADAALCDAVARAEKGQVDADLGGSVLKQRVARPGAGRSGGYRVILLFRAGDRALFAYGFAKSDRGNIGDDELAAFRHCRVPATRSRSPGPVGGAARRLGGRWQVHGG